MEFFINSAAAALDSDGVTNLGEYLADTKNHAEGFGSPIHPGDIRPSPTSILHLISPIPISATRPHRRFYFLCVTLK